MQFHDLGAQYQALKADIDRGIAEVIAKGHFILGQEVVWLEEALAADVGRAHCVSCANGTDALVLALMLWGIGAGDAVFVPDFTYFASAACASRVGARVVPVDIEPDTFNLSPRALEQAVERVEREGRYRPAVVVAVDLFGLPADYARLEPIARAHGLRILEDAAQGYGGRMNGRNACAFGDAAITSFFPAKPLGCYGDGGAVFVDTAEEAALLRSLRANGRSETDKYDNQRIGLNSRLDTLQAAILLPKLRALRAYELDRLNQAAADYTRLLEGVVQTPTVPEGFFSSWAQYTVMLPYGTRRERVQSRMREAGVPTMVYYPRGVHQQTAYAHLGFCDDAYPNTLDACARVLSLPMHPYLTPQDIRQAAEALRACVREEA